MTVAGLKALGFFDPEHEEGLKSGGGFFDGYQMRSAIFMNNRCA
jgi:hypothetical protein